MQGKEKSAVQTEISNILDEIFNTSDPMRLNGNLMRSLPKPERKWFLNLAKGRGLSNKIIPPDLRYIK